jgi:hypothetical protein
MMKKRALFAVMLILAGVSMSYGAFSADVVSGVWELGGGRWEVSYEIFNTGTEAIEELTFWFDYSDYDNFEITTIDPLGWSEIIIAADPLTGSGAGYDILNSLSPLAAGGTISGFSVAFDYSGASAAPLMEQAFEIIDPETFETQYSGTTVPEPLTLSLLAAGAAMLRRRRF